MANFGRRLLFDSIRSLAFGGIGVAYAAVGGALGQPSRAFKIDNLTDADLMFSFDNVNDHLVLPAMSSFIFDISSNRQPTNPLFLAEGTILYVKEIDSPTTGTVYYSVMYGKGD